MSFLSKFSKNKGVRDGVGGSVGMVAKVPGSRMFRSTDNSGGASTASAEVLRYLDSCFDDFDPEDDLLSNVELVERQLIERARKYSNAGLPGGSGSEWKPTSDLLELVRVALECSINVYTKPVPDPQRAGLTPKKVREVTASLGGVIKATVFFEVHSTDPNPNFPVLVIAIRGTKTYSLDWLMNLNHEVRDAGDLLDFSEVLSPSQRASMTIEAHAGYINGTKALENIIKTEIQKSTSVRHVLFTGHSAGGAVAALSFMHILAISKQSFSNFRLSVITFGAPPITSQQVTPLVNQLMSQQSNPGIAMAIVNKHDPITRADAGYITSMSKLYSQYAAARGKPQGPLEPWPLETQNLHCVGELVVLTDIQDGDDKEIKGYVVNPSVFRQLIFCDRKMHKKQEYLDNIKLLQGEREIASSRDSLESHQD